MSHTPDQPMPPSLLQRLAAKIGWPWFGGELPDSTPNGQTCSDRRLLRLARATLDALNAEQLDECRRLAEKMRKTYPDSLWSYELHDHYLNHARDLYEPESLLDKASYSRESRHNLERMLALNPDDRDDVYFCSEIVSLHYHLALLLLDTCWDAGSATEARAARDACLEQLAAWQGNSRSNSHDATIAGIIEAASNSIVAAWDSSDGRPPEAAEKRAGLDAKDWQYLDGKRWPWKAGPLPETTPSGLDCADRELLLLAHSSCEAIGRRRLGRAKRLLDRLIERYPECIWGYELYDFYLSRARNEYAPENNIIDRQDWLQASIRNFEKMLALNPEERHDVYFEAEFDSLRYQLARRFQDANWEARSEAEARAMQAACLQHLDAWRATFGPTPDSEQLDFVDQEYECMQRSCAEVVAEWAEGKGPQEGD